MISWTYAPLWAMTVLNFAQALMFVRAGNHGMGLVSACYGVACVCMIYAATKG